MRYQLVLQWPADDIQDYDMMIGIEDQLIEKLSPDHDIDGHDFGSGEMNIFIHTNAPEAAFREAADTLSTNNMWPQVRAAYRTFDESEFTILWPKELQKFDVK
jgi:hypothetical protein